MAYYGDSCHVSFNFLHNFKFGKWNNVKSASNSYNWSEKVSDFRSPLNASTRRTLPCRHRKSILNWRKWNVPGESARAPMDSTSPMENANVNFQLSYKKGQNEWYSGIMCTVGLRGEPSVDGSGLLIRCSRSADCSQGHMCDPNTHVCCKGINREFGRKCHIFFPNHNLAKTIWKKRSFIFRLPQGLRRNRRIVYEFRVQRRKRDVPSTEGRQAEGVLRAGWYSDEWRREFDEAGAT